MTDGDIPALLEALSALGDDIGAVDELGAGGETALYIAVSEEQLGAVAKLLDAGADPSIRNGGGGATSMHRAALLGRIDIVRGKSLLWSRLRLQFGCVGGLLFCVGWFYCFLHCR